MLYLPMDGSKIATLVGIDPGSETLGFAVITFNIETMEITKTTVQTFIGSKLMKKDSWLIDLHGERVARIAAHKENLVKLLLEHNPIQVAIESSFYNPRRPNAFAVLVEVMIAIKEAIREFDNWRTAYLIDPPTVKKAVGCMGNADKVKVREGVLALPGLCFSGPIPLEQIDEHSIDAIAVAYARFKELKK